MIVNTGHSISFAKNKVIPVRELKKKFPSLAKLEEAIPNIDNISSTKELLESFNKVKSYIDNREEPVSVLTIRDTNSLIEEDISADLDPNDVQYASISKSLLEAHLWHFKEDLYQVGKLQGIALYTSPQLQQFLYELCSKQWPPLSHKFADQIQSKYLIPCIVEKSWFSKILGILGISPAKNAGILGFFVPKSNKIFLIISMAVQFLGSIHEKTIVSTTFHEYQHKGCAVSSPANSLAWKALESIWYQHFFEMAVQENIFDAQLNDDKVPITTYQKIGAMELKRNMDPMVQSAGKLWLYLAKHYTQQGSNTYNLIYRYGQDLAKGRIHPTVYYYMYRVFLNCFMKAYLNVFRMVNATSLESAWYQSYFGQELFAPSEICAITAQGSFSIKPCIKIMDYALSS